MLIVVVLVSSAVRGGEIYIPPCKRAKHIQYFAAHIRSNLILAIVDEDPARYYPAFKAASTESRTQLLQRYFRDKPMSWKHDPDKKLLIVQDERFSDHSSLFNVAMKNARFKLPLSKQCVIEEDMLGLPKGIRVYFETRPFTIESTENRFVTEKGPLRLQIVDKMSTERVFNIQYASIKTLDFFEIILKQLDSAAFVCVYYSADDAHTVMLTPLPSSKLLALEAIKEIVFDEVAFDPTESGGKGLNHTEVVSIALHKYADEFLQFLGDSEYFKNFPDKNSKSFFNAHGIWRDIYRAGNKKGHDFLWRSFWVISNERLKKMIMVDGAIPDDRVFDGIYQAEWEELEKEHLGLYTLYQKHRKKITLQRKPVK